jgi:putative transcriptional regulator
MIKIKPSDLLIAPPSMPDPRFSETVLMVISHNESGTVALCLNGPTDIETQDIQELRDPNDTVVMSHPIYWGGPVARESIWMLHNSDWQSTNTLEIEDGLAVSSDLEMLEALKAGDTPGTFRVFSGFASWAPGQLEAELEGEGQWSKKHAWLVAPCEDLEVLLECPLEDVWQYATELSANSAVSSWL